jgi:hypothetical protein
MRSLLALGTAANRARLTRGKPPQEPLNAERGEIWFASWAGSMPLRHKKNFDPAKP